ncbi:MAG: DUF4292 domain-containing protein [Porphyromonadaceae bacterium]|nr:DUF4292 domain-containing protein [Porphyromonadaceae bacterium]
MNRWVVAGLALLLVMSGCRSRRTVTKVEELPLPQDSSPSALFSEALTRYEEDTSALVKAWAYLSLGKGAVRSRVQMRWSRDQALQVSILPLMGIEVCRLVFTPDTLYLMDRYHKCYAAESVTDCRQRLSFDISFQALQSLFLAQPFLSGREISAADVSLFEMASDTVSGYRFTSTWGAADYRFDIDEYACIGVVSCNERLSGKGLIGRYFDYHVADDKVVPLQMSVALSGFFSEPISLFFEKMDFEWNKPQNISTAVSLQYKRVDLQTWIGTLLPE